MKGGWLDPGRTARVWGRAEIVMGKGAGPIRYLPADFIEVAASIIIKKGPRDQRGMAWTLILLTQPRPLKVYRPEIVIEKGPVGQLPRGSLPVVQS